MNSYYVASKPLQHDVKNTSIQKIIIAKTEAAAKMLFELNNPGIKAMTCLKMAK